MTRTLKEDLEQLERRGWDALCDGTAHEFYGQVMRADGLMVLANGMVLDREQVVESLRDAPAWAAYELEGLRVVSVGDDAAALVYVGTARRPDGSSITAAMSSVYARSDGQWRLSVYTQTPLAAGA